MTRDDFIRRCDLFIFGGGGHARVLLDTISLEHPDWVVGILERDPRLFSTEVMGALVLGGDDLISEIVRLKPAARFTIGLGSAADCGPRRSLFERCVAAGLTPGSIRHPTASVSSFACIGPGTQLLPLSIVNAGARVGTNVIINSGAIVEHDCEVSDHAHIASGATLASSVVIGSGAHVGAGASVRQCLRIGAGAIVGAGAAVVRDVDPGTVVAGVPARLIAERRSHG